VVESNPERWYSVRPYRAAGNHLLEKRMILRVTVIFILLPCIGAPSAVGAAPARTAVSKRAPAPTAPRPLLPRPGTPVRPNARLAWIDEAWAGGDAPYERIRAEIDALGQQGKLDVALVEQYEADWTADKKNPESAFRWGYAAYRRRQAVPHVRLKHGPADGIFELAASPHCYEFSRLRFIYSIKNGRHEKHRAEFKRLAERLLKRKPDDRDVKYFAIDAVDVNVPVERERAVGWAQQLIRETPERPNPHLALAGIYYRVWWQTEDTAAGQKAIAGFEEYLRLAGPDAPDRKRLEAIIRVVKRGKVPFKH
jgi:hypothetical protein